MESETLTRTDRSTCPRQSISFECLRRADRGRLLFSFHGYGEDAATNLAALQRIPNIDGWLLVAVQALHPFYTKNDRIVASWMTRQDRELAIADNIRYVGTVVEAMRSEFTTAAASTVFAGFSQGVAMAYRAAAHGAGQRASSCSPATCRPT